MNTNDNKHCCVCFESFEHKSHATYAFICQVCNEGTMCDECSADMRNQDDKNIKCPICRTSNWKFLHRTMLAYYTMLEVELDGEIEFIEKSPAFTHMRKVYYGEEEYNHLNVDMHVKKGILQVEIRNIDDACYMEFDISFEEELKNEGLTKKEIEKIKRQEEIINDLRRLGIHYRT